LTIANKNFRSADGLSNACLSGCFVPTAEVGVPETLKVDGSFCSDAYKTMQIFLGNVF